MINKTDGYPFNETLVEPHRDGSSDPSGADSGRASNGVTSAGWDRPSRRPPIITANLVLLAVLLVCIGGGVGYLVSHSLPKTYGARFQVALPATATDDALVSRDLATQVEVIESRGLLAPLAAKAGLPVSTLVSDVSATAVTDTQVINVTVTSPSKSDALSLAGDISKAYLATAPASDQQVTTLLQGQIDSLSKQRTTISQKLSNPRLSAASARDLNAQIDTLNSTLSTLQTQLATTTSQNLSNGKASLLTPAYVLSSPLSPKPIRTAAYGALVGVVIALAILAVVILLRRPRDIDR